jgi:TonB family protein
MVNTIRINSALGPLIAAVLLVSPIQQSQKARPEPTTTIRRVNAALRALAINRVEPIYPPQAATALIFGTVIVEVTVDESGNVTSVRPLSGHPLLHDAATNAARGWTFKPTIVDGKPIKVLGSLAFTFKLPEYLLRDRNIEQLRQQIAVSPQNSNLQYRLGLAYEANEQLEDALMAYSRAVTLKPNYGDAQVALAAVYTRLNRLDDALQAYDRAVNLALTPQTKAAAYQAMAMIHLRRDQFQEAVAPFKRAIALAPEGSMFLNLGLTYLKLGDKSSAIEQCRLLKEWNSILAEQLLQQINEAK